MVSEARQTANAANAHLSTGPRTEQGKARSSQNARKHGLTAAEFVIAAEDREEFEEFLAELQADVSPKGKLQQVLFDQLAESAWNLRRIRRMEAELTTSAASYLDILENPELTAQLDRLARHKTRIERTFHRSLRELKALQTDAALALTLPVMFVQTGQPLASRTQIAKRTQALALAGRANGVGEFWSAADAEAAAVQFALDNHQRPQTQAAGA
jgi:hypothetical protein